MAMKKVGAVAESFVVLLKNSVNFDQSDLVCKAGRDGLVSHYSSCSATTAFTPAVQPSLSVRRMSNHSRPGCRRPLQIVERPCKGLGRRSAVIQTVLHRPDY
ncbi:hypothetical protein BaRGS_00014770 [Batillaria attramentaria]|uniref:Uncharacterized protein n=1 Tax=Batillaria attramentaria TaxID=370345 RepID=A0ABD0L3M1_9CAEN